MVNRRNQSLFTLFVPTYNRRQLLPRLLESVEAQTFQDFELLIIDDGSQDGTFDYLRSYQPRGQYQLRVLHQENQGRHVAFNRAFEEARGYLFTTINSDDTLTPNALERLAYWWQYAQQHYADVPIVGVEALCADMDTGEVIGAGYPESPIVADRIELHFIHRAEGDKIRAVRTNIIARYRFPQVPGEKYIRPSYLWHQLGFDRHKLLCVNEILSYKEYRADGVTRNRTAVFFKSPRGLDLYYEMFFRRALADGRVPEADLISEMSNWIRYALLRAPLPIVLWRTWRAAHPKSIWRKSVVRGVRAGLHLRRQLKHNLPQK